MRNLVGPDLQRAAELTLVRGGVLGRPLHLLSATTSTNDQAKLGAKQGAPSGATWVAEHQRAGRGRHGREWWSARGESLLFSVLVHDTLAPPILPQIALAAGLAVHSAVSRAAPEAGVKIKWPNDVVAEDKKVAGVLVEATTVATAPRAQAIVIGIGINVHTHVFPSFLKDRATSVALLGPRAAAPDRATLLADTLAALERDLAVVAARGFGLLRARIESADALYGRFVRNDSGEEGIAAGIDDQGRLTVRRDDGVLAAWIAGEVRLA